MKQDILTEKIVEGVYQILCFAIEKIEQKPMFLMHNTYFLSETMYKDVLIARNKNPELQSYVVMRIESRDINGDYFPDIFQIIEDFNHLNHINFRINQ